jgi:hypothetical protein
MRELTPETITHAVLEQMATTADPRLKEIMAAAVKHLHAFACEVNLTPAEWLKGIEFMTAVGKMCTPERQEFILLSDTLGLSALVNGLHDRTALEEATHTSLLGPFFRENAPRLEAGAQIASKVAPGTEIALWGKVTNVRGEPLANAQVSVWQTGADGLSTSRWMPAGQTIVVCSPRMRGATMCFALCGRSATRSRWTAPSASLSRIRAAMACARPTSTSSSAHLAIASW